MNLASQARRTMNVVRTTKYKSIVTKLLEDFEKEVIKEASLGNHAVHYKYTRKELYYDDFHCSNVFQMLCSKLLEQGLRVIAYELWKDEFWVLVTWSDLPNELLKQSHQ